MSSNSIAKSISNQILSLRFHLQPPTMLPETHC